MLNTDYIFLLCRTVNQYCVDNIYCLYGLYHIIEYYFPAIPQRFILSFNNFNSNLKVMPVNS